MSISHRKFNGQTSELPNNLFPLSCNRRSNIKVGDLEEIIHNTFIFNGGKMTYKKTQARGN